MHSRRQHGFKLCVLRGYHWCGPGCSGPGEPINEVDAACKIHDECYRTCGDKCYCDIELMQLLAPLLDENSERGRHARLIYRYMKMQSYFTCRYGR